MNKKLLALAVAGACVAPSVMAQTANPVTLYGRVYVMVESTETDTISNRTHVSDQSSLLGVRGTEDLGGGLKAWFQLETGFAADAPQTSFATRNSGVGLQGGWGSVMIGRWDMPFKSAAIGVDPYGDLTLSGITGTLSDRGNFDRRDANVMQYWSPNMGGFAFRLAGTANEAKDTAAERQDFGANLTYRKGPLYLFGAYEEHQLRSVDEEGFAVGGSYAFGSLKLGGQYQNIDKGNNVEQDNWMGNLVWTAGKHQFIYQYMQSELDAGPKCDSNSVGYQYNWSKRTFFLATYVQVDNDPGQNCNFGNNRQAIDVSRGEELKGFAAGIRHVF